MDESGLLPRPAFSWRPSSGFGLSVDETWDLSTVKTSNTRLAVM